MDALRSLAVSRSLFRTIVLPAVPRPLRKIQLNSRWQFLDPHRWRPKLGGGIEYLTMTFSSTESTSGPGDHLPVADPTILGDVGS